MPLQNRVTPEGEIVAAPGRGLFMGNRGRFHTAEKTPGDKRWTTRVWVTCEIRFKERRRTIMAPDGYTELFFLDEAVALAAGHRPCGECRREAYRAFREAWRRAAGGTDESIQQVDQQLHKARVDSRSRRQVRHEREIGHVSDGAFVALDDRVGMKGAWLVRGDQLLLWTPEGYRATMDRPRAGTVEVLTPSPTVDVLAAGYRPALHPSVDRPHD